MNIVILNGSPKGKTSVTMQYMAYLQRSFPHHSYRTLPIAQQCLRYEKNPKAFGEILPVIGQADFVIWAFPLYYMLVHSRYKRFIELIFERGKEKIFSGKYTASFSTSIHFYDHTAHEYIHGICDDLGMKYIDGVPAHMRDLMDTKLRDSLRSIFMLWELTILNKRPVAPVYFRVVPSPLQLTAGGLKMPAIKIHKRVVLVGDLEESSLNLQVMVNQVKQLVPDIQIMDLNRLSFGHCLGCLKCGPDNQCAYEGKKDGFLLEFREKLLPADIVIFAGAMHDRYLSSRWQRYLERNFNRTHQPVLRGKQVGFLVAGALFQNHNAREILTAYTEVMGGNLVGMVTDENGSTGEILARISRLVNDLVILADSDTFKPVSFLGQAGMKLFRDEIFGHLRFVFQADHRYYKKHRIYDFPQKNILVRLMNLILIPLSKLPFFRRGMRKRFTSMMILPYQKIIRQARPVE